MTEEQDAISHHPSSGAERSAVKFQAQRLAQVTAPERIEDHLALALDAMSHMDDCDSDLRNLALVIVHCTRAVCTALDARS